MDLLSKAKKYFRIYAYGCYEAKTIQQIQEALGCDNRKAREIIHQLRTEHNMPIISISRGKIKGYFLYSGTCEDDEYARHFINETFSRISEIRKIIKPVEKLIRKDEQLSFF